MNGRPYTHAEDVTIRALAGKQSAQDIAAILDRPKHGVHHRIKRLGLTGHLHGEHHWAAKVDGLRMAMVHTLLDAGFGPAEVHKMFEAPLPLTHNYIKQIACARHRKRG